MEKYPQPEQENQLTAIKGLNVGDRLSYLIAGNSSSLVFNVLTEACYESKTLDSDCLYPSVEVSFVSAKGMTTLNENGLLLGIVDGLGSGEVYPFLPTKSIGNGGIALEIVDQNGNPRILVFR